MAPIIRSSSCPARPTKGRPCSSSSAPGASPTKHRRASGLPRAKTVWIRVVASPHLVQPETSVASWGSRMAFSTTGAATGTAWGSGEAAAGGGALGATGDELEEPDAVGWALAFGPLLRGNPTAPASFCHSRYARSDAAMLASSARGSSLLTTDGLRRSAREVNPESLGRAGDGGPVVIERGCVALVHGAASRLAPETMTRIAQHPDRGRRAVGLHVDLQRHVGLVHLIRVGLGGEGAAPLSATTERRRTRTIGAGRRWGRGLNLTRAPGHPGGAGHRIDGRVAGPVACGEATRERVGIALHDRVARE